MDEDDGKANYTTQFWMRMMKQDILISSSRSFDCLLLPRNWTCNRMATEKYSAARTCSLKNIYHAHHLCKHDAKMYFFEVIVFISCQYASCLKSE
jgi:hypothetical protein